MKFKVEKNNEFGFYEILPRPTEEELRVYYEEKYYQEEYATYQIQYPEEELKYFKNKINQKDFVLQQFLSQNSTNRLLDVGCGEGFTMDYFHQKKWDVMGLDFSDFGLGNIHPHLKDKLIQGNVFLSLTSLLNKKESFDVVWLDNVLEHVVDPIQLLKNCLTLTNDGGMLVIEVPNDFSTLQQSLMDDDKISEKYWEAFPDHLTYFSKESLMKAAEAAGWQTKKVIGDFPIEWFLANEVSNYNLNKSVGKKAHEARVYIENHLHNEAKDMSKLIEYYEALGNIGQGRQLIGFFAKKK